MKAIQIFLNHPKIGNKQSYAARLLGVPQQYIYNWTKNKRMKKDMPIEIVPKAAEIIGVHPNKLRPDVFKIYRPKLSRQMSKIKRARAGGMEWH